MIDHNKKPKTKIKTSPLHLISPRNYCTVLIHTSYKKATESMPEANAPKPNTTTDKKNPKKDKGKPGQGRDFLVVDPSLRPDHVRQTMKKKKNDLSLFFKII